MLEIENVYESYFRGWVFSRDYNFSAGTYGLPDNDSSVAIIREFLQGNSGDIRLSANKANSAVSMVQTFEDAATTIRDKLQLMEALAEKAAFGYCPEPDKVSLQKQIEGLAEGINDIANSTEYDDNKLFGASGETISESIGNGYSINLFARDLRFNIGNVDLTKDAQTALSIIKKAQKEADECTTYIGSQNNRLQNAMAAIETQIAAAAGLEASKFETEIARKITSYLATAIQEQSHISSQSQSNITHDEALYLLKDQ
ncbi:MAG: flagellin [Planctomycetota bacterium]